jgi:uncharacterized membrane-anchored protein
MKYLRINQCHKLLLLLAVSLLVMLLTSPALAANAKDDAIDNALIAALKAATKGPKEITLLDQATLTLPKDFIYIPRKEAEALLLASGNKPEDSFIGLIMPEDSEFHWFVPVDFVKSGYIATPKQYEIDAESLLKSLQKNTALTNKDRAANGFPVIQITNWIEKPEFDAFTHELTWSLKGQDSESYQFINFNHEVLGREGYFEFTLLSQDKNMESSKAEAEKIISSLKFKHGKRYEDYVADNDPVSEYSLDALVVGENASQVNNLTMLYWLIPTLLLTTFGAGYLYLRRPSLR